MNASNQPTNQVTRTVRTFTKKNINSYYKENQQHHLKELEGVKKTYEAVKKDYLDFLRLSKEGFLCYLLKEDKAVQSGQMKEEDSSLPVFMESATKEEIEKAKEVIVPYRLDFLTTKKKSRCMDIKKQIDYVENVIRFWVSLRQGKYKPAVKYNKLCEEYELYIIDAAVDGNLYLKESKDFGPMKPIEGETEISRLSCEYFYKNRKKRKELLDIFPYTLANDDWSVDIIKEVSR